MNVTSPQCGRRYVCFSTAEPEPVVFGAGLDGGQSITREHMQALMNEWRTTGSGTGRIELIDAHFAEAVDSNCNFTKQGAPMPMPTETLPPFPTLSQVKDLHVTLALVRTDGNALEAAKLLGIGKTTMYRILADRGEPCC